MGKVHAYKDFYAVCNHMPGSSDRGRLFRVGGTITFATDGWDARLERKDNQPVPISPLSLQLELVLSEPSGAIDVLTDVELPEYREENPAHEYYEVVFSVRNADGSASAEEPPPTTRAEHANGKSVPQPDG